ncbi:MAG: class I SAM-dependent methyltransferase [Nitrosospira sp.]
MLASARQLNEAAITAGRVNLQLGSAGHLPFAGSTFDKAFSIHCIYFWKEPLQGLCKLHRVLKPAGRLAITVRDKEGKAYQAFRADKLAQLFTQTGFF